MKILIALLDYDRDEYTQRTVQHNIETAAYDNYELRTYKVKGISKAINTAFEDSNGKFKAIVTMANDILMPLGWLEKMVQCATDIDNSGVIAAHTVEKKHQPVGYGNHVIYPDRFVFGNAMYTQRLIENVGHFNEDYDPYGMQDSDYCLRAHMNGFINYYIDIPTSEHIGHDVGQDTEYRRMKDAGLTKCPDKWMRWTARYERNQDYRVFYTNYKYPRYV